MTVDSRVSLIMTEDVVSIGPDTPVDEIARLMWENNLGTLPVVENQRLIGILTDFDLITRQSKFNAPIYLPFLDAYFRVPGSGDREQLRRILATTARELMSSDVMTINLDTTVQEAATVMYDKRINALPVVDGTGKMVGIVSRADIVRLMVADEDLYLRTHAAGE